MHNVNIVPVIAGIAAGIVLIIVFALYSSNLTAIAHNPPQISVVTIPKGASDSGSGLNFDPKTIKVVIGINNTVEWKNLDNVPSTVVSDQNYQDPLSGNFSSLAQYQLTRGGYLLPGETYNFTFTKPGSYGYHSEPDPWMYGTVIVSLP
jgi:plastocyanin